MDTYYLITDIRSRTTYIFERKRKNGRLVPSAMPADRPGGDVLVDRRKVPLAIRRAVEAWEKVA